MKNQDSIDRCSTTEEQHRSRESYIPARVRQEAYPQINPNYYDNKQQYSECRRQSQFNEMKKFNDEYHITSEHIHIQDQFYLREQVRHIQYHFESRQPIPFQNGPGDSYARYYGPLIYFARQLATPRFHSFYGILLLILGALSAATWGRVTINLTKGWTLAASLMLIQVAPSGTQKSRIISELRKPFDEFKSQFMQDTPCELKIQHFKRLQKVIHKEHDREILKKLREDGINPQTIASLQGEMELYFDSTKSLDEKINKTPPTLFTETTTPAGLIKRLAMEGEAGACIIAEGDLIIRLLLAKSSDPYFFNKCYDQEPHSADISQKKIDLKHPYFCMLCFVQPHILMKLLKKEELLEAGTIARILPFFHSESEIFYDSPAFNPKDYDEYSAKIISMLNLYYTQNVNAERYEVNLDNEALHLVYDYENYLDQAKHNTCKEHQHALNKLAGQAVRLAWAIHAWNNDIPHATKITAEEVAAAITLCKVLEKHIEYCYMPEGLRAYNNAIKIVKSLQSIDTSVGNETLTQGYIDSRTLQQRTHIKSQDIYPALCLLERNNWLKFIDNGKRSYIVIPHRYIRDYKVS